MSSQELIRDFKNSRADLNKLFKLSASVWKVYAPDFFLNIENMQDHVTWLFEANVAGDRHVKPLNLEESLQELPKKLGEHIILLKII